MTWVNKTKLTVLILASIGAFTPICALERSDILDAFQAKALPQVLQRRPNASQKDIQIQILNLDQLSIDARNASSCNIRIEPGADLIGKTIIFMDLYNENNLLLKKAKIVSQITVSSTFLKTKRVVTKDQVITSKDVDIVYEDDYAKPIKAIRSLLEIKNKVTAATLGPGVYLAEFMLKNPIIIHRGDNIEALMYGDNLEIKIRVIALEEGSVHQHIKLRSTLKDQKTLEGEILDSKTVRISALR